jgi:sensor histidine kinase YesM
VVDLALGGANVARVTASRDFWLQFLGVSMLISSLIGWRYRQRWLRERLEARATEAQLRLMQAQIEPHFLFNTLANVQSLIDFDPGRAKAMLEGFTDYLRASMAPMRSETTTLAQEFAMLEAYLGLMQLRMGPRLRFALTLPADLAGARLPPLLVQPLIENAIHHGLEPCVDGGEVRVSASREGEQLCITVADDGRGLGASTRKGNGLALGNIRDRLAGRWGERATLTLAAREGGGTLAQLRFPHAP